MWRSVLMHRSLAAPPPARCTATLNGIARASMVAAGSSPRLSARRAKRSTRLPTRRHNAPWRRNAARGGSPQ